MSAYSSEEKSGWSLWLVGKNRAWEEQSLGALSKEKDNSLYKKRRNEAIPEFHKLRARHFPPGPRTPPKQPNDPSHQTNLYHFRILSAAQNQLCNTVNSLLPKPHEKRLTKLRGMIKGNPGISLQKHLQQINDPSIFLVFPKHFHRSLQNNKRE